MSPAPNLLNRIITGMDAVMGMSVGNTPVTVNAVLTSMKQSTLTMQMCLNHYLTSKIQSSLMHVVKDAMTGTASIPNRRLIGVTRSMPECFGSVNPQCWLRADQASGTLRPMPAPRPDWTMRLQ